MNTPAPPSIDDYDAISDAVMETERGRWFLREFARRNRVADTELVLGALARMERKLAGEPPENVAPAPLIEPRFARLAAIAAEIRSALMAPKPPEQRIALALDGVAALETALDARPVEAIIRDDRALLLAPPSSVAPRPVPPSFERPADLDDVAFREIGAPPLTVDDVPSAWAWADEDKVAPAPRRTPDPVASRKAVTLLESLSEAEKALLFA